MRRGAQTPCTPGEVLLCARERGGRRPQHRHARAFAPVGARGGGMVPEPPGAGGGAGGGGGGGVWGGERAGGGAAPRRESTRGGPRLLGRRPKPVGRAVAEPCLPDGEMEGQADAEHAGL